MDWTEIKVKINVKDLDVVNNIAYMVSPCGIYVEDYSKLREEVEEIAKIDLIDEELLDKNPSESIVHMYISPEESPSEALEFLNERLKSQNIDYKIENSACKDSDWANNWKKYFKPTPVGNKLLIRPIWIDDYESEGRAVLNIEPGMAFGTGTHETTRLCLELLEKYVNKGDEVLDVGCGSGILSVASLLLGAKNAVGVDIDEISVKVAADNAKLNGVSEQFEAIQGSLTEKINGKFDLILANIVADVIIKLVDDVENYMKENSIFIMSGIIDMRVNDVKNALKDKFDIIDEKESKGWFAIAVKQK